MSPPKATLDLDALSVCPNCGQAYLNFCVKCARMLRNETVEQLMIEHGLTLSELIARLALNVHEGSDSALRMALNLVEAFPASRTDVTSGGQPLGKELLDAKDRLLEKLAGLSAGGAKEQSDSNAPGD